MPKYFCQEDSFSCGPIAIVNALSYIGMGVSKKTIKTISNKLGADMFSGTSYIDLVREMSNYAYIKTLDSPNIEGLINGFIIIRRNHFMFAVKQGKKWLVTNYMTKDKDFKHKLTTKYQMKQFLKAETYVLLIGGI